MEDMAPHHERITREAFDRRLDKIRQTWNNEHYLCTEVDGLMWQTVVDHLVSHRGEIEAEFKQQTKWSS